MFKVGKYFMWKRCICNILLMYVIIDFDKKIIMFEIYKCFYKMMNKNILNYVLSFFLK